MRSTHVQNRFQETQQNVNVQLQSRLLHFYQHLQFILAEMEHSMDWIIWINWFGKRIDILERSNVWLQRHLVGK